MRPEGTARESEQRRHLALARLGDGWDVEDVADFLGVTRRSVERWAAARRAAGDAGLAARPAAGRPKSTADQGREALGWLARNPSEFGSPTERWTGTRLAALILKTFGVSPHPRHLPEWLRRRGHTPQKPEVRARERDEAEVAGRPAGDWGRLKKRRPRGRRTSSRSTTAASS